MIFAKSADMEYLFKYKQNHNQSYQWIEICQYIEEHLKKPISKLKRLKK